MEFGTKLQQLRKANNMTQEHLAEKLYVSRTAVSKWDSGRGYPNLESLKAVSRLFSVSIDELLSNNELIILAESENRSNIKRLSGLVFGALDIISLAFLFMPLFGMQEGEVFRSVSFLAHSGFGTGYRIVCFALIGLITALGAAELVLELLRGKWSGKCKGCSLGLHAAGILLFALSRQAYVTAFIVKVILVIQEKRMS